MVPNALNFWTLISQVRPAVNALASIADKDRLRKVGVCTASAGKKSRWT